MALALVTPVIKTLFTVASTSTTSTSPNFTIPIADSYTFYLVCTAATGTLDVVFQTSIDGGTTYCNVPWRFAQNGASTAVQFLNARSGVGFGNDVALVTGNGGTVADTTGAMSLQAVVDPRFMKAKYTITTGPYAFSVICMAWPRGSTLGVD